MFRCNLVRPNGDIKELDTRVLGDTSLAMTSAMIANEVGNRTHQMKFTYLEFKDAVQVLIAHTI